LLAKLVGQLLEPLRIARRPPVANRAGGVDLAALVVEAVSFMADDRADRAMVTAASACGSNGGCRMPAGNTILFSRPPL
jgi:hypothetical protein